MRQIARLGNRIRDLLWLHCKCAQAAALIVVTVGPFYILAQLGPNNTSEDNDLKTCHYRCSKSERDSLRII